MRIADFAITAAVVAGLSGTAMAQTSSNPQTPANPQTAPVAVVLPTFTTPYTSVGIVSAYVGSNFNTGQDSNLDVFGDDGGASINFGGQVAYLWRGFVGAEGLVDFSPSFSMDNLLFEDNPTVNTYMINFISAVPVGAENQFLPYFSGGFGAVQLRSTIFTLDTTLTAAPVTPIVTGIGTVKADGTRFGGNVGGGVMGFSGGWGFRGDLRYYRASIDNNVNIIDNTPESIFAQEVVSGLSFWKANVGVAYRW